MANKWVVQYTTKYMTLYMSMWVSMSCSYHPLLSWTSFGKIVSLSINMLNLGLDNDLVRISTV